MARRAIKSEELKTAILVLIARDKKKSRNSFGAIFDQSWKKKIVKLYMIYLKAVKCDKENKRLWVTEKFSAQNRFLYGASMRLIPIMEESDKKSYFKFFRMCPETFQLLHSYLEPIISPQKCTREPICAKERLQLVLRYLATGDLMFSVGVLFRISEAATHNFVAKVCSGIWETLRPIVFEEPSEAMWRREAEDFENLWQFKNCIGAMDGKLVPMEVKLSNLNSVVCGDNLTLSFFRHTFGLFKVAYIARAALDIECAKARATLCKDFANVSSQSVARAM